MPASNTPGFYQPDLPVSIDTVEGTLLLKLNLPTSQSKVIDKSNQTIRQNSSRYGVAGKGGRMVLQTTHLKLSDEYQVRFSGSIPKYLAGQNLCCPPKPRGLIRESVARFLRKVKEHSSDPKRCNSRHIGSDEIQIRRIDMACCFKLQDKERVREVIHHLYLRSGGGKKGHVRLYGKKYLRLSSKGERTGYHVVFYDKTYEVRCKLGKEYLERLGLEEGVLKVELRLERDELQKLNLTRLASWADDTPRTLFQQYVGKLLDDASLDIPRRPIKRSFFEKLPAHLRPPYVLLAKGVSLEHVYSDASVHRYQSEFAKLGIKPAVMEESKIRPIDLLSPERAIKLADIPEEFREGFTPKALRRDKREEEERQRL